MLSIFMRESFRVRRGDASPCEGSLGRGGAPCQRSSRRGNDHPIQIVDEAREEIMRALRSSLAPLWLTGWLLLTAGCASSYTSLAPERVDAVPAGAYHVKVSEDRGSGQGYAAVLLERETSSVVLDSPMVDRGDATGAGPFQAYMRPGFVVYAIRGNGGTVEAYLLASPRARVRVWDQPGHDGALVVTLSDATSEPEMGGGGGGGGAGGGGGM